MGCRLSSGGRAWRVPRAGGVAEEADVDTIAPTSIGAAHLLFAQREDGQPPRSEVENIVRTVVGPALAEQRWQAETPPRHQGRTAPQSTVPEHPKVAGA